MKPSLALLALILVVPLHSHGRPESESVRAAQGSLFAQSAAQALNHDFPNPEISFLLLDARTGQVLASRWDRPDLPIPLGSLAKPFAALAYGEQHAFRYPAHFCEGTATGCWRPGGHGDVDLTSAIAYSCNSYFRFLTTDLDAADVSPTATRFGLEAPDHDTSGARSGRQGTGAEVDRALQSSRALVKTGTAACTHSRHAPGDGFTVALVPEDDPKMLLMVRVHGGPGSQAARIAGQILHRIED